MPRATSRANSFSGQRALVFAVTSAEQLIEQTESQLGLMTLQVGTVGSISLIVGGIGEMNIMLISVPSGAARSACAARAAPTAATFSASSWPRP